MYRVHDWAEVHRLRREGKPKTTIADQLGMSRTTVIRLLRLPEPPAYARSSGPSLLDAYKDEIAALLDTAVRPTYE